MSGISETGSLLNVHYMLFDFFFIEKNFKEVIMGKTRLFADFITLIFLFCLFLF